MRVALYTSFVALAASLAVAAKIPAGPTGPTDAEIKELTRTRLESPFHPPTPRAKTDYGWIYHPEDKVQQAKEDGECKFQVIMDVSRCAGMATKQEPVAYPYDQHSMDMMHNHINFETGATKIAPYAQKVITLTKCGFNGRFMLMDQFSDNIYDTGRMSIRLVLEKNKATHWVTAQTDEETGEDHKRVAPLIRRYTLDQEKEHGGRIFGDENMRGKAQSIMTTTNTTNNILALQWC